jgi:hypothetical protein
MATPPQPPPTSLFGEVGKLFSSAKKAVADTVAPLAPTTPPPTLPGAAPEGAGRTLTGGRRHRKTKALRRSKRRSTRKTTRRVRKSKKGGRKY